MGRYTPACQPVDGLWYDRQYAGPEEAYRFGRGETVTTSSGQRIRAVRPLDFLVVADHAENLGLPLLLAEGDPALFKTKYGRRFYDMMEAGQTYEAFMLWGLDGLTQQTDVIGDPQISRTAWERQIETAEQYRPRQIHCADLLRVNIQRRPGRPW